MTVLSQTAKLGFRIRNVGRLAQITNTFARHGLWSVLEAIGIRSQLTPEQVRQAEEISKSQPGGDPVQLNDDRSFPVQLRKALEELGPAFVKLGQVLAVRDDLLPPGYTAELQKLHQNVVALPYSTISKVLEEELGGALLSQFQRIEEIPLAAGSIGQVHEAWLTDGHKVVIKVQRPGIKELIDVDLALIESLAGLLERYLPESRPFRPQQIVGEFRRGLMGELDFVREGGCTSKVAANLAGLDFIVVPKVHWKLSTAKVLTLDHLDGVGASDKRGMIERGINPPVLVERGFGAFLQMVFVDGLFHGDLHPGNLLALDGDRIGFIDFGLTVRLSRTTRENLAALLVALVQEDYTRVVAHFAELADPGPEFDLESFESEVANTVSPFVGLALGEIRSGAMLWDLARMAAKHGAPLPRELVLFMKTLVTFEGIGHHLDPDFEIIRSSQKMAGKIVADMYSPDNLKERAIAILRDVGGLARTAPFQLRRLLKAAIEGDLQLNVRVDELDRLVSSVDRISSRFSLSLIASAFIIGASILTAAAQGNTEKLQIPVPATIGFAIAGLLCLVVVASTARRR